MVRVNIFEKTIPTPTTTRKDLSQIRSVSDPFQRRSPCARFDRMESIRASLEVRGWRLWQGCLERRKRKTGFVVAAPRCKNEKISETISAKTNTEQNICMNYPNFLFYGSCMASICIAAICHFVKISSWYLKWIFSDCFFIVVSSNPGPGYWMDIFHINLL